MADENDLATRISKLEIAVWKLNFQMRIVWAGIGFIASTIGAGVLLMVLRPLGVNP